MLYKSLVALGTLGALALITFVGSYVYDKYTPRPSRTQTSIFEIGDPNIRLNPPLKVDEECFKRHLDRYFPPDSIRIVATFKTDDETKGRAGTEERMVQVWILDSRFKR